VTLTELDTIGSPLEEPLRSKAEIIVARVRASSLAQAKDGIECLRGVVRMANQCPGDWLAQWTIDELVLIWQAFIRSDFDVLPHRWTDLEIEQALLGSGNGAESER
jgi:hypothetical protein